MVTPVDHIIGGDEENTGALNEMTTAAREFITSHPWCPPIRAIHLAGGVVGIIALFLIEFDGKARGKDDRLWVVVGDLTSCHMVVKPNDTPQGVLEGYCEIIDEWISAMMNSEKFDNIYPVAIPEVANFVNSLRFKLDFVRKHIIPRMPAYAVGHAMFDP